MNASSRKKLMDKKAEAATQKEVIDCLIKAGIWVKNGQIAKADVSKAKDIIIARNKAKASNSFSFNHDFEEVKFLPGMLFDVGAKLGAIYEREEWGSGWLIEDITITKMPELATDIETGEEVELKLSPEQTKKLSNHLVDLANKEADEIAGKAAKDAEEAWRENNESDRRRRRMGT